MIPDLISDPLLDNVISGVGFKLPSVTGIADKLVKQDLFSYNQYRNQDSHPRVHIWNKIGMQIFLIILSHLLSSSKRTSGYQFWSQGVSAGSVVAAMLAIGCQAEDIFKLSLGHAESV